MNETLETRLAQDLAMARSLAEDGRRAPLVGGAIYIIWGVTIAACLGLNWAIRTQTLQVTFWAIPAIWFAGTGVAGALTGAVRLGLARRPGAAGIGNSVTRSVWTASGLFLALFAAALFVRLMTAPAETLGSARASGEVVGFAFSIYLPVCFGVYAVAMSASAQAAQSSLLKAFSRLSFAAMVVTAAMIGRPEQLLLGAVASLLVLAAPGAILMRRERAVGNES